jgi:deoxyribodipyrimidine photo-lyase
MRCRHSKAMKPICAHWPRKSNAHATYHYNDHHTMSTPTPRGLMWFRRDLRSDDNAALYHALKSCSTVYCVFVFDQEILDALPRADRRVEFIRESLLDLDAQLRQLQTTRATPKQAVQPVLIVRHAWSRDEIPRLAQALDVQAVFTNHDYEPQAIARDAVVQAALAQAGVAFHTFKDHVIFEREEVLTQTGKPYGVFTPYKNAWLKKLTDYHLKPYPTETYAASICSAPADFAQGVPSLAAIGFETTNMGALKIPAGSSGGGTLFADFFDRMDSYHETRNYPAIKGPSYLGVHLRFGTVSIRKLCATAHQRVIVGSEGATTWLSELIWRDFYVQILANFPRVAQGSFKPDYDAIQWEQGPQAQALFAAWCEARTGYPIVDAAMAQINQTGYMHNRLRMVVASFLTKDLGLDWRWGERYFAEKLNDFDLSANNGGWQWASSSGCDAQPYFRIFNPSSQSERFDAQGKFIRRYLPQLAKLPNAALHAPWDAKPLELQAAGVELGKDYPHRIVKHDEARAKTLQRYAVVKKIGA